MTQMILLRHHILHPRPPTTTTTAVRPAGPGPRAQPCYLGGAKKACAIAPEPLNIYSGLQALLSRSNRLDSNLAAESFTSRRWWRWWGGGNGRRRQRRESKDTESFCVFYLLRFFFFSFFSRSLLARAHSPRAETSSKGGAGGRTLYLLYDCLRHCWEPT